MKGKPWTVDEEKKLKELVMAKTPLAAIAKMLDKAEGAVRQKIRRLGVEVVEQKKIACTTTSKFVLPKDLISIEESLLTLSGAILTLKISGLDKAEVLRLRGIIVGCKIYQEKLANYMNYRELEAELFDLREKYEAATKKS